MRYELVRKTLTEPIQVVEIKIEGCHSHKTLIATVDHPCCRLDGCPKGMVEGLPEGSPKSPGARVASASPDPGLFQTCIKGSQLN